MKKEECNSLMGSFSFYTRSEEKNDLSLVDGLFHVASSGSLFCCRQWVRLVDLLYDLQQIARFWNGHEVNVGLEL